MDSTRRPGAPRAVLLRRRRPGFTLVELVITLAVVAVVAAMAVPRFGLAMSRYRLDVAARRLVADLSYARQRARTTSQSVTVSFNAGAASYSIAGMADPDGRAGTYTVDLTLDPYRASIAAVSFSGRSTVTFSGFGNPDAGGDVTLVAGSYSRTVHVDAVTGVPSAP